LSTPSNHGKVKRFRFSRPCGFRVGAGDRRLFADEERDGRGGAERGSCAEDDQGDGKPDGVEEAVEGQDNVRALCELRLAEGQGRLVAPAAYTVAEGHYEPGALLRAIYSKSDPVGVLLVEVETGTPYLVRFMVDASHQRRGVGRQAVELLAEELRRSDWTSLETSFVPVEDGAEEFWRRCGFKDTGRKSHGEPVFVLKL